jgi:hypothetical protein
MKFGNEFWLILFREYISPKLFAVGVVMMRMFPPTMERKNHLYKEDVGVDPAEGEGGGDGGDD